MSELKEVYAYQSDEIESLFGNANGNSYYLKSEADAVIAELKDENQRLKKKMDDYHLMSDIRRAKIKELKRTLWLAMALALSRFDVDEYLRKNTHCNSRFWNNGFNTFNEACKQMQKAINIAEAKCRAKAKEFE